MRFKFEFDIRDLCSLHGFFWSKDAAAQLEDSQVQTPFPKPPFLNPFPKPTFPRRAVSGVDRGLSCGQVVVDAVLDTADEGEGALALCLSEPSLQVTALPFFTCSCTIFIGINHELEAVPIPDLISSPSHRVSVVSTDHSKQLWRGPLSCSISLRNCSS